MRAAAGHAVAHARGDRLALELLGSQLTTLSLTQSFADNFGSGFPSASLFFSLEFIEKPTHLRGTHDDDD